MNGWAVGDGDSEAPKPRGHVVMGKPMICGTCLITSDGGETWERVWLRTNFKLRSIWMASKEKGQICNHCGDEHPDGGLIITTDGGKNWRGLGNRAYRGLNDCFWLNEKTGWAVGSPVAVGFIPEPTHPLYTHKTARIITTTDGGTTWTPLDSHYDPPYNYVQIMGATSQIEELHSIRFTDIKHGVVVGDNVMQITSDGGEKWVGVEVPKIKLYCFTFSDSNNGWVVGENGVILEITDVFKNIKVNPIPSQTKNHLYSVKTADKGKIVIAVGDKGTILRYSK
jgi:photosystem II stability/assembly factor-like uncharacterized protein